MNLTYNIRSIPILSKRLYKINIFNNNQNFADVNFMIDKNIVTINNIASKRNAKANTGQESH